MIELPRYEHDCTECIFLGKFKRYDLYFHPGLDPTIIARYSSDGPDYISGLIFKDKQPLMTAYQRAKKRRLI